MAWEDRTPFEAIEATYNLSEKEVKKLTKDHALKNIHKLKKDLFNFRFQKINGQLKNPSKINQTKKKIARLKTYLENNA